MYKDQLKVLSCQNAKMIIIVLYSNFDDTSVVKVPEADVIAALITVR